MLQRLWASTVLLAMLASAAFAQQPSGRGTTPATVGPRPSGGKPAVGTPSKAEVASPNSRGGRHVEPIEPEISVGQLTPTPEMWFYEQSQRKYRDPKVSVRRRAEFNADQRQQRLAATRWYGFDNSRPITDPAPWSGNWVIPYNTSGRGRPTVIVMPYTSGYVPYAPYTGPGYGMW